MGRMIHVGYAVFVRGVLLGHYLRKSNAMRRAEAEKANGVAATVHETWSTFAVGEREEGEA